MDLSRLLALAVVLGAGVAGAETPTFFTPPAAIQADLAPGAAGLDVAALQFQLKLATGAAVVEDGVYGEGTAALVRIFQLAHHLPPTGLADEATRTLLHAEALAAAWVQLARIDAQDGPLGVPSREVVAANVAAVQVVPGVGDRTAKYRNRRGFAWGDGPERGSLRQASTAHVEAISGFDLAPAVRRVFAAISKNEGPFDAVNSYDAGHYTWGAYQLIGSYRTRAYDPADDELAHGLAWVKRFDPHAFAHVFQRFGVDVDWDDDARGVIDPVTVRVTLLLPDGTVLAGDEVWQVVGTTPAYNQVFIDAGADLRIQRAQVLAAYATHFDALDLPITAGDPIRFRDALTSERSVAAFLDLELNQGRSAAKKLFGRACREIAQARRLRLARVATWTAKQHVDFEAEVLARVRRLITSRTYRSRFDRVLETVIVSDVPGSYRD